MRLARHFLLGASLALPAPALAQAYQCRMPERLAAPPIVRDGPVRQLPVTGYTLALSWSPEYCRGKETRAADALQCSGRNGSFGLVVHGLWPEGRTDWPQWCPTPRQPSPADLKANICLMPSAYVLAHEWAKHGACMTRRPAKYFKVTRILWNALRIPDLDLLSRRGKLSVGDLRKAWLTANPGWRGKRIGVLLNERGWLREIKLCYGKGFMPTDCDQRRTGAPDSAALKIWRGL